MIVCYTTAVVVLWYVLLYRWSLLCVCVLVFVCHAMGWASERPKKYKNETEASSPLLV